MSDADLAAQLWNDYQFRIASYIGKQMRREWGQDVINDLVSIVFLRACVAIDNGNGPTENAGAWLFQIARSVILDHLRAQKWKVFFDIDEFQTLAADGLSLDELTEYGLQREKLYSAIEKLDNRQAELLRLRLAGYENDEIASLYNCKQATVRAVHTRAYANLREWLKEAA